IQQNAIEFIPCRTQHQKLIQNNLWSPKITSVFEEDDVIVKKFGYEVDRKSLSDLISGSKINDLIVNFYIEMVCNSNPKVECSHIDSLIVSKILNGNLTRLSRYFEKNFKADFRLLFCPALILKDHWVLFVFDSSRKSITCYDSIFRTESEMIDKIRAPLTKYITSLSGSDSWTIVNDSLYPKQKGNDKDCGVFVCAYSKWLAHVKPFSFKQNDIPKIRKTMGSEVLKGQIEQFDCLEQ
ncbi:Sentrin-specific protease, partial [Brachionus plicatilis]